MRRCNVHRYMPNHPDTVKCDVCLTTQLAEARAENERLRQAAQWQDMASAPHGKWILVSTMFDCVWQCCWNHKGYWVTESGARVLFEHANGWMELPAALAKGGSDVHPV